jgi:molecular chaperone DnaK
MLPDTRGHVKTLVYDLGGGSFDVSVIERGEGVSEVLSVNGDTVLGGADFDRVAVDYCLEQFKDMTGVDLSGDPIALMRIRDAAERAKIALSSSRTVTVDVPYVAFTHSGPRHLSIPLSRTRYNELTHQLVARTIDLTGDRRRWNTNRGTA